MSLICDAFAEYSASLGKARYPTWMFCPEQRFHPCPHSSNRDVSVAGYVHRIMDGKIHKDLTSGNSLQGKGHQGDHNYTKKMYVNMT